MYYKGRCQIAHDWWSGNAQEWTFSQNAYTGSAKKAVFRPYQSFTALTKYNFSASIQSKCGTDFLKIESNM